MILRALEIEDQEQACQAHADLALDNFSFLLNSYDENEPWQDFIARVNSVRRGEDLPEGKVPATFLVAEVDEQIIGRVSIRHHLNDYLLERGGHIGYGVRPIFRKRGYATEILRRSLEIAHDLGIESALVTCDDLNIASSRVIEKCGGILENIVQLENGEKLRRYWVVTEPRR